MTESDAAGGKSKAARRRGRPSPDEIRAIEAALFETATRLFCEQGYSEISVETIARAAGIGKKAIYARYPTKEALFSAVMARLHSPWVIEGLREEDGLPIEAGLFRRARAIIGASMTAQGHALYQLLQREGQRFPALGAVFAGVLAHPIAGLTEYFRRQAAEGAIINADPATLAVMFIFAIFGDYSNRVLFQAALPDEAEIDAYLGNVAAVFARGIATGSDGPATIVPFVPGHLKAAPG